MKSDRLSKLLRYDRLQCSPIAIISVIGGLFIIGIAGAHHASAPATTYVTAPQHAAAGHPAHLAAGLVVAGVAAAVLLTAAGVVRWMRCGTCWRPGTRVAPMRLDKTTGTLQPVAAQSAELLTEAGERFGPVVLSEDGVTPAGVK